MLTALLAAAVIGAPAQDAQVLHTWHGEPNGYFGWAVSELKDIDHDGATDVIVGEPGARGSAGTTWVLSARSGRTLFRFDGASGDRQGNAIADAGDTDRDGVDDIISGANQPAGAGRATLYSGRDGHLLHAWRGKAVGDRMGSAVSGAGDVNLDGYDDVAVGAQGAK